MSAPLRHYVINLVTATRAHPELLLATAAERWMPEQVVADLVQRLPLDGFRVVQQ